MDLPKAMPSKSTLSFHIIISELHCDQIEQISTIICSIEKHALLHFHLELNRPILGERKEGVSVIVLAEILFEVILTFHF